jgi:alkylation response protein AidB-like acyl-CoA dehydrogenase
LPRASRCRTTSSFRTSKKWVVNGQKTFITSGINADFVIVVVRTDPEAGARGFSLIVVETGTPGFTRGRKLDKIGLHAQGTGRLNAVDAAKAKWWASELQKRVVDRYLQLHGGYGYMLEYPGTQKRGPVDLVELHLHRLHG